MWMVPGAENGWVEGMTQEERLDGREVEGRLWLRNCGFGS